MRTATIAACLLLASTSTALACYEDEAGPARARATPHRVFAEEGGEGEASATLGASLLAAGSASLAAISMAFRTLRRAAVRGRVGPVPVGMPSPSDRPRPPIRVDRGHEPAGLMRAARSGAVLATAAEARPPLHPGASVVGPIPSPRDGKGTLPT